MNNKSNLVAISIILTFSLLVSWPFFRPGYFETQDGGWWIIRFSAFHQAIRSGQFPVRVVERLNNNYSYPVFNFTYPLPFYLAELPKLLGFNFTNSIKFVFVTSIIASGYAMYWALTANFSRGASLIGALVYLAIPYRLLDLYVRGSIGENLAFVFFPLAIGSLLRIAKGSDSYLLLLSLSTAAIILSHNILAVLFLPIVVITLINAVHKKRLLQATFALLLGLLMTSFFSIPALLDLKLVQFSNSVINPLDHLIPFSKLFFSQWGYGPLPRVSGGFSAQIGILSTTAFIMAFVLRRKNNNNYLTYFWFIFVFAIFMISPLSSFLWENIQLLKIIQHPWRFLAITTVIAPFFVAFIMSKFKINKIAFSMIFIFIFLSAIFYTKPLSFNNYPDTFYSTNESTTAIWNEYSPVWVTRLPSQRADEKLTAEGEIEYTYKKIGYLNYQAGYISPEQNTLKVNTIFFPGFKAFVDKKEIPIGLENTTGLMKVSLPKGDHEVIIKYGKTPVHLLSEVLSLFALTLAGFLFLKSWHKKINF